MGKWLKKGAGLLLVLILIVGLIPVRVMAETTPVISYCTHVQNIGWQDYVSNGATSGTAGKSYRLEGIKIKLDTQGFDLGVSYQTHIQNIGWESDTDRGWKNDGFMSGTEGLGYRLEAIQIKLTGSDANQFDVYYQVHAQNMGWLGWAKNGESAGTAGYGYRLEAINILVVAKGSGIPSGTVNKENPFYKNPASLYSEILAEYRAAEVSRFSAEVTQNLPYVTTIFKYDGLDQPLYYMVEDLSGDSTPELVVAGYDVRNTNNPYPDPQTVFRIIDVYRLVGDQPERVFDMQSMGYRAIYTICENNVIKKRGSGGAVSGSYEFFKLYGDTTVTKQRIEYDGWTSPYYYFNDGNVNNLQLTREEAFGIINGYIPRTDINWAKLSN